MESNQGHLVRAQDGEASLSWWSQVTLDEVFPEQLTQLCEVLVDPSPYISYTFGKIMLCH